VPSTAPDWLAQINSQVFARHLHYSSSVSWKDSKGIHGTSGLNSVAMNFFRILPAILLFPAVLCVCSFAEAEENPQQAKQTISGQR